MMKLSRSMADSRSSGQAGKAVHRSRIAVDLETEKNSHTGLAWNWKGARDAMANAAA
jgi:hypothetical protein